ncbi:MAG: metallophosphoesterase [Clostridia bacterium]|nr:metallophosphoesterase [Clostridia bacterium]
MKILVFSDSHSHSKNIEKALEIHNYNADLVVFLGDGIRDIENVKNRHSRLNFFIVKGNCDVFFSSEYPDYSVLDLDGIRVLITHGHLYGVKSGYDRLLYKASEVEADAVFFGHTHAPIDFSTYVGEKRIHLFNPGSIGYDGTYGVINTSNGVLVSSHGKI